MSSGLNRKFQQVSGDLDVRAQFGYSHCCKQHLLKKTICDSAGVDAKTIHRIRFGIPHTPCNISATGVTQLLFSQRRDREGVI